MTKIDINLNQKFPYSGQWCISIKMSNCKTTMKGNCRTMIEDQNCEKYLICGVSKNIYKLIKLKNNHITQVTFWIESAACYGYDAKWFDKPMSPNQLKIYLYVTWALILSANQGLRQYNTNWVKSQSVWSIRTWWYLYTTFSIIEKFTWLLSEYNIVFCY